MKVYQGNTSTEVSQKCVLSMASLKYIVTNVSGGSVTLNIFRTTPANVSIRIAPKNLVLLTGQSFTDENLSFFINDEFKVTTSGALDYYFSFTP